MTETAQVLDIEELEKRLPRWEKWLFACAGATLTLLAEAFLRSLERRYIVDALFLLDADGDMSGLPAMYLQAVLNSAWWWLLWLVVETAALFPGITLLVHSAWRKVVLPKRHSLMMGYFLCAWLALLASIVQDPVNVSECFNILLILGGLALGLTYGWLRYRERKAETLFP